MRASSALRQITGTRSLCPFSRALRQVTGFLLRHPTHPRRQIGQGNSCVCGLHPHSGRLPERVHSAPAFPEHCGERQNSSELPRASSTANSPRQFLCLRASSAPRKIAGARSFRPFSRALRRATGRVPGRPAHPRRQIDQGNFLSLRALSTPRKIAGRVPYAHFPEHCDK